MSGAPRIPGFQGGLVAPADSDYELARLTSNAACDARPAGNGRAFIHARISAARPALPCAGT